ncbi:MAG: hypothetical protein DMF26_16085 [Verrucomicrobia bacterium]|nr:MAG: hypothetical protein DMF26_16085 [Verrucomicrobiota bacterium]
MRARASNIAASILLLIVGGVIYALWRSRSLLMFQWFDTRYQTRFGLAVVCFYFPRSGRARAVLFVTSGYALRRCSPSAES